MNSTRNCAVMVSNFSTRKKLTPSKKSFNSDKPTKQSVKTKASRITCDKKCLEGSKTLVRNLGTVILPAGPKSNRQCDKNEESRFSTMEKMQMDNLTMKGLQEFIEGMRRVPMDDDDLVVPLNQTELLKEESVDLSEKTGNVPDHIVRVVKCQINVRKNGQMEVIVPGDKVVGQKLQNLLHLRLPQHFSSSHVSPTK